MKINPKLLVLGSSIYGSMGFLGLKRGYDDYNYLTKKFNRPYLYSHCILNSLFGFVFYAFPISNILFITKEIYRLEVNLRNLEDQKQTDYYNQLI
jgi:hypothetical protein